MSALDQLYAEAGCVGEHCHAGPARRRRKSGTLQVTIPPIASDAAISVDRGNPGSR